MGWPDGPVGRGLNGLARPDIRPTDRAWAVRQARWTVQARPGGPAGQKGPSPIGPCLARARAVPCRAGPLLIFTGGPTECDGILIIGDECVHPCQCEYSGAFNFVHMCCSGTFYRLQGGQDAPRFWNYTCCCS